MEKRLRPAGQVGSGGWLWAQEDSGRHHLMAHGGAEAMERTVRFQVSLRAKEQAQQLSRVSPTPLPVQAWVAGKRKEARG